MHRPPRLSADQDSEPAVVDDLEAAIVLACCDVVLSKSRAWLATLEEPDVLNVAAHSGITLGKGNDDE